MTAAPLLFALIKRQSILIQFLFGAAPPAGYEFYARNINDRSPIILSHAIPDYIYNIRPKQIPFKNQHHRKWKCQIVMTECIINCLLIEATLSGIGDTLCNPTQFLLLIKFPRILNCDTNHEC